MPINQPPATSHQPPVAPPLRLQQASQTKHIIFVYTLLDSVHSAISRVLHKRPLDSPSPHSPNKMDFRARSFASKVALFCGAATSVLVLSQSATTQAASASDVASFANTARRLNESDVYVPLPCDLEPCIGRPDNASICDSDGKVYLNECFFKNEQCRNADKNLTSIPWDGLRCPTTCTKPIKCNEILKSICGSDGNVYKGYCSLYEAQCVDPELIELKRPPGLVVFPPRGR